MWCIKSPLFVLQSLLSHLDYDDSNLHTVLISLGQVAKLQPNVFATKHKGIIRDFIVKNLLVVDRVGCLHMYNSLYFVIKCTVLYMYVDRQRVSMLRMRQSGAAMRTSPRRPRARSVNTYLAFEPLPYSCK